jgi:hypothetical protein
MRIFWGRFDPVRSPFPVYPRIIIAMGHGSLSEDGHFAADNA